MPYFEDDLGTDMLCFRLGYEGNSQDFYVKTSNEMDGWVAAFRKVSILSGVFDDYSMGDMLGEGSYAKVLKASDTETGAIFAIKCISKQKLHESSQGTKILVNEIDCMRRASHPNILKLERVYDEDDTVYLVLEYAEGGDLFGKIIAAERFTEHYCAILARKLLSALAYMHEHRIIHRDIKLENIMMTSLDEEADIKIVDFGFACEMTPENLEICCGSPGYVAPEILNKQPYDGKADVFSVGIVLYIILSGNSPFIARTVEETIAKNREGRIRYDNPCWGEISEAAKQFVVSLTERHPRLRPTSADAMTHSWIQEHNRQYFDSLIKGVRRPALAKRGVTIDLGIASKRSPGLPTNAIRTRLRGLDRSVPSSPMSPLRATDIRPGFWSPDGSLRDALSPHTLPRVSSPGMATLTSAGNRSNKRNITWKQIKPHY
jgi:calcium/calmodulin-dependent protein kinase I